MSDRKDKAPGGGEAITDEMKAKLALLERLSGLGMLEDLTAQIEKKEADVKVAMTKGAVQKAVHVLTAALKGEGITNSRLAVDWGEAGVITFKYGPRRKSTGTAGVKNGRMVVHGGKVYENSDALAAAIGGMPSDYKWGAATWLKRVAKIEFAWVETAAVKAAIASGKYKLAKGNTISE